MVNKKQTSHLLFALFCGSIAMSLAKDISANSVGAYQYLFGMAACITCNGYWLLSRSIFRGSGAIQSQHLLLAGVIGVLVMINQGYWFINALDATSAISSPLMLATLGELTNLLSSCILVLSFWEGCRGFSSSDKTEKAQRLLFLATFGGAVIISKVTKSMFAGQDMAQTMAITTIIIFIVINTQVLLLWRSRTEEAIELKIVNNQSDTHKVVNQEATEFDKKLANQIQEMLVTQTLFLQPNLKIADVARKLEVSEYRVSNAIRYNLNAKNFNQYVNELRIQHAKQLLSDSDKHQWPVLVVGLESGFASVGPFTRAFKSVTGFTPNQYRKKCLAA